ncbi:MAG TPA: MFS transporter, partial [bacterium]|nr:MFS transporter [bacterium]
MSHAPSPIAASMTENSAPTLPFVRKWGILVVLSLALAIIILDTTILNVALSSIIQDLDTDIQSLQWVITAYSLTLAALTITGGRMGDIFGRKRMFVFGAFLFAVGSFLASISTTVPMLILGESIIEGVGAALMMPATASLLVSNFKGQERAIAFGIWGGIAGASVALGPVLGGFLATNYSWRWGFRVNLIVVGLLMIGSLLIPRGKEEKQKLSLDLLGVLLSATGMLSLVFGIIESSKYGWFKAVEVFSLFGREIVLPANMSIVPVFMLAGTVILGLFMAWERYRETSGKTPLVSMEIFKNRMFTSGIFTSATMALGQTGLIFALPVFLQSVRGLDAYHTGLALLPMSLGLLVISPLSAVLGRKIPSKYLINFGLFLNAVAYLILWYTLTVDTTASDLILGLTVYGIGMGFVMSQINNITLSAVPVEQAGEASGVNNTLRQVGSTLGSAIMGAVLVGALGTQLVQGVEKSEVIPEAMKPELAQIVETQSSNVEFGGGAQLDGSLPAALKAEIVEIGHEATVD